jgi:hypothetical protein
VILRRPSFDRAYNRLNPQQRTRVDAALTRLEESFGRPHQHVGIGIRSIGHYFECRAGLQLRILFVVRGGDLILVTVGNHDHVARFIKA